MKNLIGVFVLCLNIFIVKAYVEMSLPDHKHALDLNLYKEVLNPVVCEEQLEHIRGDENLMFKFFDAGPRIPKRMLKFNRKDLGSYNECLEINQKIDKSVVEGKYCMIRVPIPQTIDPIPIVEWIGRIITAVNNTIIDDDYEAGVYNYNNVKRGVDSVIAGMSDNQNLRFDVEALIELDLAVCIPKVCSTNNTFSFMANSSQPGFQYSDLFCRLPNDKPWVPGDFVAIVIFSIIAALAILSTAYDVRYNVYLQKDPKKINKLYQAFSVYNNTTRLMTYIPVPGAIECLDGVRSLAMTWVILGHTFVTQTMSSVMANPADSLHWIMSIEAVWITAGPITVDTFFMLSGLLLVYTTHGKVKPMKLLQNLHLFYLNRILRILPVLCPMILLQVSLLNWIVDGPYWFVKMVHIHNCRVYWWSTILHMQNFYNPAHICLPHSWYLAIDLQLYIISPLVLVWVLTGRRRVAWSALFGSLLAVLSASMAYNFIMEFQSATVSPSRVGEENYFLTKYYVNTLTRAAPFFIGLIVGYLLSINKGKKNVLNRTTASLLWLSSASLILSVVFITYPTMQLDWNNQLADNFINTFMRPLWAIGVGCLVFVCEHGYGGIVNWILTLKMFKVLSRLSYAMYIVHYPLMFIMNAMPVKLVYFNVPFSMMRFFTDFSMAVIVAFLITILVDSPCSVLIKHFLGGGVKKPRAAVVEKEPINTKQLSTQLSATNEVSKI